MARDDGRIPPEVAVIWVIPVIIAGGMAGLIAALHMRRLRLELAAAWTAPPKVRVPDGSPVRRKRLHRALHFWKSKFPLGFKGPVYGGGPDPADGEILVLGRSAAVADGHAGETLTGVTDGVMVWAVVHVPPDHLDTDDPTLEHELGHALGLTHNCLGRAGNKALFGLPRGHVMSAELARAEFRADGAREAFEEGVA